MEMGDRILYRSPEDLEQEAIQRAVLKELRVNALFNFLFFFLLAVIGMQDVYISLIIGNIGFCIGGFAEGFAVFIMLTVFFVFIKLQLGDGVLAITWNFLMEEYRESKGFDEGGPLKKLDKSRLPFVYKLVLRIPVPSLDSFPSVFQGIIWAIGVPIFIVLFFISTLFSLVYFPFPINIILTAILPSLIFLMFLRVILERFLKQWNAMIEEPTLEWNVEELIDEYIDLLKKQRKE